MAKRQVVISTKDASTLDILNTIRMNASQQYQDLVPEVTDEKGDSRTIYEIFAGFYVFCRNGGNRIPSVVCALDYESISF